ncbi:hypothetical protein [Nocardiopsis sp. CC223A]|uniref:hypothetical protein n=1 Tax=Nocardiopsis sp. CC223A TaxID=3044051 RepID=UPI00278C572C|nr:hypothetical protein [Nocardiopsis sp. CC223A]
MSLTPSHLCYLREAVETASWDTERRLAWVRRTGFAVDEIALRIDDFHGYAATRTDVFPEGVRRNLSALVAVFNAMAGDEWAPAAVHASARWETARVLAAAVAEEPGDGPWLLPDEAWNRPPEATLPVGAPVRGAGASPADRPSGREDPASRRHGTGPPGAGDIRAPVQP